MYRAVRGLGRKGKHNMKGSNQIWEICVEDAMQQTGLPKEHAFVKALAEMLYTDFLPKATKIFYPKEVDYGY